MTYRWRQSCQCDLETVPGRRLNVQGFPGGSDLVKNLPPVRKTGSIPGTGRFPGAGNGNPLQYSCLEIPTDRGAWLQRCYKDLCDIATLSSLCPGLKLRSKNMFLLVLLLRYPNTGILIYLFFLFLFLTQKSSQAFEDTLNPNLICNLKH